MVLGSARAPFRQRAVGGLGKRGWLAGVEAGRRGSGKRKKGERKLRELRGGWRCRSAFEEEVPQGWGKWG